MGRKQIGFFRIKKISGKEYLIKVKNRREGDKIIQEFIAHIGSVKEIKKVVCQDVSDC